MMTSSPNFKPLRILLSEGTSTSAREAVTVLGLAGHVVDVCDPAAAGLARFSRFVRIYRRCPGMRENPLGFLRFIEGLLATGDYDVLLPIHEQGFLFAKVQERLRPLAGLALPSFASYRAAHSKAGFSRMLSELGLPQPETQIVASADTLRTDLRFPCVIKTAIGTASRGVWMVRNDADLALAMRELEVGNGLAGEVLVQARVAGATEKAQGVFCRGELVGFHVTRQIMEGAGGGDAIKRSVRRDRVRGDLAAIGRHLAWHGALSIDFIMPDDDSGPFYIDCNPRLVEPMAACLAGVDLVDLLLRVSLGETPDVAPTTREGVVTHQAMQVLLGSAQRGGDRRDLLCICRDIWCRRGDYAGSTEELTPVRIDWLSVAPLMITALLLLVSPGLSHVLAKRGWGAHLLDAGTVAAIESGTF
ncbi:ATP-grasp domain-containing protein [Tardiphaga sp. OK246]|jgi:predicted ATP-grasp superfamily ATP-dependent carboligase|uniref:ATP-grasp domain-containing protein n=1 Tax=Tardiphaga sp. OK246 TaxID=1855307 RepID=UPI000B791E3B|nr:ATP-grasp domain-containing protein [Tardiphaga sp. OK246]